MRIVLKFIFLLLFAAITFSLYAYYFWNKPKFHRVEKVIKPAPEKSSKEFTALITKASSAKKFAITHHLNSGICFLVDMKISSGKNRFFVYDLQKDSIIAAGLVAHGSCDNGFQLNANFSNTVNSGCTSIGKFKVGNSYIGKFGLAYKLYGLDSTNNNAYQRSIVLHSYKCVPEKETQPLPICNSRGCPMVSPGFLIQLKLIIGQSKKPILLWIY